MSELDSLSDSDWLDISSSRESDDNDSIISADSDHKVDFMPLSRRSSVSVGSSREGDVEAWEGFIDDSGDEEERNLECEVVPAPSITADIDDHATNHAVALAVPAHVEITEEQRVKEALDQSLISTLCASRSSAGSTHNSLRDLRLSFPDPLTSSHNELHSSYNNFSPSDTHTIAPDLTEDIIADDSPNRDHVDAGISAPLNNEDLCLEEPHLGVKFSPGDNKAEFEVVLYGSPSSVRWILVEELVRKMATVSGRTLQDALICPGDSIRYLNLQRKIDESLSISEFVAIHDRTADILDSKSLTQVVVERPSLAIIYLPAPLHSVPEHSLYLPVFAPPTSSDGFESLARITAYQDWENLHVPAAKTAYLNDETESPIFDCRNVNQVTESRADRLLQHLNNAHAKKRSIRSLSDQLSSVHAVTLFALMSLIVGFAANTAFRMPSSGMSAPSTTFWKIFGTENNRTSVFATTAEATKPIVTTTVKNVALSILSPVTTSLTTSSSPSAAGSISTTSKVESIESKPFAWIDRAKLAQDIIVRPTTQLSADTTKPSMTMIPHAQSIAGPSKATLGSRVVDSLSEVLDTRVRTLVEDVRSDFDELMESFDELSRAIRRQTQSTMQQSKSKANAICESVVYRNDRARGKAKELKKIGKELIVAASEHFKGRTDIAKNKARDMGHSLVPFETWREYQKAHGQWVARLKDRVANVERRRGRIIRCNRKSTRIGRKIQRAPRIFGCAV
ncbi:hypothetical protein L208DRAFT_1405696 [Tricholoma matsutake]|nr:hypothetical protein L208DRAFT_1405696 [Tricholoma matsutake 945]